MGIESTLTVKHQDALLMLREKNITVYEDDGNSRLQDMLYDNKESIFCNYCVVDNDYVLGDGEKSTNNWREPFY